MISLLVAASFVFFSLDNLKTEKLDSMISIEEYKKEEEENQLIELLGSMFDEEGNDIILILIDFDNRAW